jgi:hypothetical protein
MNLVKTNISGFYKDINSGAVINKNNTELQQFMAERNRSLETQQMKERIDNLTNDVNEIKNLLKLLVANKDGNSTG